MVAALVVNEKEHFISKQLCGIVPLSTLKGEVQQFPPYFVIILN